MNNSFFGTWKASALMAFIWFTTMLFNAGAMVLHTSWLYAQILAYPDVQIGSVVVGVLLLVVTLLNAFMAGMYGIQAVHRFRSDGQDN